MGQMTDDLLFDPFEDGPELHETECRRCGVAGLSWEDDNGRWRLVDHHGKLHVCDPARLARAVASDFDDNSTRQDQPKLV